MEFCCNAAFVKIVIIIIIIIIIGSKGMEKIT